MGPLAYLSVKNLSRAKRSKSDNGGASYGGKPKGGKLGDGRPSGADLISPDIFSQTCASSFHLSPSRHAMRVTLRKQLIQLIPLVPG